MMLGNVVALALLATNLALTWGRSLPKGNLLVGYASKCGDGKVEQAVRDGVNVVIWSFASFVQDSSAEQHDFVSSNLLLRGKQQASVMKQQERHLAKKELLVSSDLDLDCIRSVVNDLKSEGYTDVVHMLSMGGWNGGHFSDSSRSAQDYYKSFLEFGGDLFDGIDWDFEGSDDVKSPDNFFSKECLDYMGQISQLAKQDGFIVSASPPQSYLDFSTMEFSRYVNHTNEFRQWHPEHSHLGKNVYAYLLQKYGEYLDFVSVKLYESYSRAGYSIQKLGANPETYLESYATDLGLRKERFRVKLEDDEELGMMSEEAQYVHMPLSKLVIGLANGWATTEQNVYISPNQVAAAFSNSAFTPRGFMFYTIDEEGTRGINFAKGMNDVLHIR